MLNLYNWNTCSILSEIDASSSSLLLTFCDKKISLALWSLQVHACTDARSPLCVQAVKDRLAGKGTVSLEALFGFQYGHKIVRSKLPVICIPPSQQLQLDIDCLFVCDNYIFGLREDEHMTLCVRP